MPFRAAMNAITIKQAPLLEKIRIVGEAGYQGIGLWADELERLRAEDGSLEAVLNALWETGLQVVEICAVGGWMWVPEEKREEVFARCEKAFRLAEEMGCEVVIACAGDGEGEMEQAIQDYAALCDLGGRYGVTPALEFIGPLQRVKDVASAWEVVKAVERPNAALLLDTFHFYRGGSRLEDLAQVPGDKVALVHINDVKDLPREQLTDGHRVMPGEGILPLQQMLSLLDKQWYYGYLSLELFNEQFWGQPAAQVAQRGRASLAPWVG